MSDNALDILKVNLLNWGIIGVVNLSLVKDWVTIVLGIVSIISTVVIITKNLRKKDDK